MNKRMIICTAAAFVSLVLVVLLASTLSAAYDPATYAQAARAAYTGLTDGEVTRAVGLTREAQAQLAEEIVQYFRGKRAELDMEADIVDPGTGETHVQPAFHERERAHMADVRGLLDLAGRLMGALALVALVAATAARVAGRQAGRTAAARAFFRGSVTGALALALPVLALSIWGAVDFTSLFYAFHGLAFTNDLWLLNPQTDLLIRMMPEGLFVRLAASIAIKTGAVMAALLLLAGIGALRARKGKEAKA